MISIKFKFFIFIQLATLSSGLDLNDGSTSNINLEENVVRTKIVSDACENDDVYECQNLMTKWLTNVNDELLKLNVLWADFAWKASIGDATAKADDGAAIDKLRSQWRKSICGHLVDFNVSILEDYQRRQIYLLCRGITFTENESVALSNILNEMQNIYTATKICIPKNNKTLAARDDDFEKYIINHLKQTQYEIILELENNGIDRIIQDLFNENLRFNISDKAIWKASMIYESEDLGDSICLSGEPDLERIMASSRNEMVLKWSWLVWRQAVGPPMKPLYSQMIMIQNTAAQRQSYSDIGEVWREELEVYNLKHLVDNLYNDIKELYTSLHGVVRHFLQKYYNQQSARGFIPAHLTGNMWAQNWETILNVILPITEDMDLNAMIKKTNWTSVDMVKHAEDFYTSLGLPSMTKKFWQHSYFGNDRNGDNKDTKCHGTAANMFQPEDYRMIYCAGLSMEDFYVIHHEMGHIQYYMSYANGLPTIFQDGTNSAFQESIGDAIMLGVMAPQHLERLGLINDKLLYIHPKSQKNSSKHSSMNNIKNEDDPSIQDISFDEVLMLRQALTKIPQIPFGYIIDKYRWDTFSNEINTNNYNEMFWYYVMKYQGVEAPDGIPRSEKYFDVGAKFHVPDNTPYIRYFLSSFLQVQMFKGLCQWSLFGVADKEHPLPMPLHRCDIYGSKKAGKKLKEMMSAGSSIHWSEALYILTGEREISSSAFLEYFAPLQKMLNKLIKNHDIYVGWDI